MAALASEVGDKLSLSIVFLAIFVRHDGKCEGWGENREARCAEGLLNELSKIAFATPAKSCDRRGSRKRSWIGALGAGYRWAVMLTPAWLAWRR
jgi:hypothetical protein